MCFIAYRITLSSPILKQLYQKEALFAFGVFSENFCDEVDTSAGFEWWNVILLLLPWLTFHFHLL